MTTGNYRTASGFGRPLMALACALALATPGVAQQGYIDVDPFIGTGGEGHTFPGAVAPFGMVQLSPDTDTSCVVRDCYDHAAGYRHDDPTIQGFSHTHFSGSGHSDLGDVLVMPVAGAKVSIEPGDPKRPGSGYRSRFVHQTETAQPGYYAVTLSDSGVRAEMTADTRIGVHRYTFPSGQDAHLILDLRSSLYNYPGKILWSSLRLHPDGTITGYRQTRGWAPGRHLYFAMRFSSPLAAHQFLNTEEKITYRGFQGPGRGTNTPAHREGQALVGRFDFGKLDRPLEVKVAISSVDEKGAIANLDSEPGDFDTVCDGTRRAWGQALSAVEIDAAPDMRKNLYTTLYHSLIAPSVAGDADGR